VGKASFRADMLCLVTALIWGLAFVAQRVGMESMGPLAFNGVRFALGAVVLAPLAVRSLRYPPPAPFLAGGESGFPWRSGLLAGTVLFFRGYPATGGHDLHHGRQGRIHYRPVCGPGAAVGSFFSASGRPVAT